MTECFVIFCGCTMWTKRSSYQATTSTLQRLRENNDGFGISYDFILHVNEVQLHKVQKFKYIMVLFSRYGSQEKELDRYINIESRVAREEWKTFVGKARLSREAKLAVFKLLFRPIITYRHESWIITERMQSQVQVVETRFPEDCWINNVGFARMNLPNSIWNTDIRESLHIEPLLLMVKKQER